MNTRKTASRVPAKKSLRRGGRRRVLFLLLLALCLTILAGGTLFSHKTSLAKSASQDQAGSSNQISRNALQQIEALIAEKKARTPVQQKIDPQLLFAAKMHRGEAIAEGVQTLAVNVSETRAGYVVVDITGNVSDSLIEWLKTNGATILISTPAYGTVRAEVALNKLEDIASSSAVRYIQSKQEAMTSRRDVSNLVWRKKQSGRESFALRAQMVRERLTTALAKLTEDDPGVPGAGTNAGARTSEGDITHRANIARSRYGVDGTGVKIGVLSDGVVNLATAQLTGDVPDDVTVLPGQAGTGDEGTAMLEIIHDLAPGAKLFFATAFSSIGRFAQNIKDLRTAGCDIIVDDVFYFVEAPFQDGQVPSIVSPTNGGIVTQAVNDVTASGALYFSSAGNEGNLNDGTAGVFEGDFVDGGTLAVIGGAGAGPVHDFDPSGAVSQFNRITLGSGNPVTLAWSDPLGGSANDYDLYILNSAGTALLAASTGGQDGNDDPFEIVSGGVNVTNNRIVVAKFSGSDRFLHVNTFRGRLLFATFGQTHGHASAAEAYAVAATPSVGPFPMPFTSANVVETFESDGPRKLYFQPDGTPYTPGNFLSTGGLTRQKPDITAADGGVVSGAGGFPNPFFGTSAAAPHAGAIAALVKSSNLTLTPAQIRAALIASAIDIEAPGVDRDSGAGIIMADTALQAAGATPVELELGTVTATEVSGNGNSFVEPGERGALTVELRNNSTVTATNITATLTTSTAGVTIIPPASSSYPDIASGATATNTTPFEFFIASDAPCPDTIDFTLTVNYTGGSSPKTFNFNVTVNQSVTIDTTLDTTAPPNGAVYTATSGLQTGRLVRTATGSNSSCGIVKPNPGINAADATVAHRYDAYTFHNNTSASICVTVTLSTSLADAGRLQSVAYAPTFNPLRVSDNYLGDIAGNGPASRTYSFMVPPNTDFVVVVNEVVGGGGVGTAYTLKVDGLPCSPPPATAGTFSVAESDGILTLTVLRTGGTTGPFTVDYATSNDPSAACGITNGFASQRCDYLAIRGTLQFAAGENSKSLTIFINDDVYVEGPETFTLALSNENATFGVSNTTVVTIVDNDTVPPTTNPIDDPQFFVREQYRNFLNRDPDAGGLAFWVGKITECGTNQQCINTARVTVSAAFFLSEEFQQTGFFVYRLHKGSLGNRPTYADFLADRSQLRFGFSLETDKQALVLNFIQRSAFLTKYPLTQSGTAFIDALLQTVLTSSGLDLSTKRSELNNEYLAGTSQTDSRARVVRKLIDYPEFAQAEFNSAFVTMQYFGYLNRDPDPGGFAFWLNILNTSAAGDFRAMVCAFITSAEYQTKYSPVITHTNADCAP
jgi:hypothetical protein